MRTRSIEAGEEVGVVEAEDEVGVVVAGEGRA